MGPGVLAQHALHGPQECAACRVVMSALMKLAGGSPTFSHELNVDAFLRQVGLAEGQRKAGSTRQAVSIGCRPPAVSCSQTACLLKRQHSVQSCLGLPARTSASGRL